MLERHGIVTARNQNWSRPMLTQTVWLLVVVSVTTGMHSTTADPFVGRWRFNADKSTLIDQMSVQSAGKNRYTLNFGGGAETVVADGTDQPGLAGTTVSITIEAPNSWRIVRKIKGRTVVTGVWKLSEDATTLHDHFTQYSVDGAPSSTDYAYTRTAGSSGFTGTWETSLTQGAFGFEIKRWARDGLSLVNADDAHRTQNLKFDGKDYPFSGPNLVAGAATSGRRLDERTLEIKEKIQGKVSDTRRITLSSDKQTLTMTIYPVGRSKPSIFVFDRE